MITKQDLNIGAILQDREGSLYLNTESGFYNLDGKKIRYKVHYNDDLTRKIRETKRYDIMKVNNNISDTYRIGAAQNVSSALIDALRIEWDWERKEEILDKQEKAYLEAVIRPFKNDVKVIEKRQAGILPYCFIIISVARSPFPEENIGLPLFESGTMYNSMIANREYTLKELGLFNQEN